MRILLLTGHTCYVNDYAAFTVPVMHAYCQKHGYDFVCETNMQEWNTGRPYPWAKLIFIKKWLQTKQYEVVIWMDADSVIMNHAVTWQNLLASQPEGEVYMCEQTIMEDAVPTKNVNTGVMVFKNTIFSQQLLEKMWDVPNSIDSYIRCDQSRLIEILKRKELETDTDKMVVCPQRLFNSMLINDSYHEGDFLVHFAGYGEAFVGKERTDAIREFAKKVLPALNKFEFPSMDAYFSHSVVINLDRREDRWKGFIQARDNKVACQRVSAIDAKIVTIPEYVNHTNMFTPGAWALAKTTQNIIQDAINNRFESVLIMEDDIEFTDNCKEYLFHAMLELPNDWKVLLLSQFPLRTPREVGLAYWQKPRFSFSCAMYVVRDTVFSEYLEFLQNPEIPIDNFMVEHIQPRGKCYGLKRSIAYQIPGESDIDSMAAKKWAIDEMNHNVLVK